MDPQKTQNPEVKIENVEKNFDKILEMVGTESYVNWETFTKNSSEVVKAVDELNKNLSIFREVQHKNFIQTMKKLKSLDVPDLIKTVKAKKLPKEALRGLLPRFKLNGEDLELKEPATELKVNATKELEKYIEANSVHSAELNKLNEYLAAQIKQSGIVIDKQPEVREIKSTVKFDLSNEKAQSLASAIQIQYLPNTLKLIGLKTYAQIVEGSYDLVKTEYEKLTNDSRVKQRESVKDSKNYLRLMNEYLLNSEALIIEAQNMLGQKVGLEGKKLQESEIALMERGLANNILMLQSQLRAKIKESMPPSQDVSLDVAKEVIVYQTKMIGEKSDHIKDVLSGLERTQESAQLIPMLLALILNDMVFEKFGYEEEDFMKNVGEEAITTNPELTEIFRDMQVSIIRLMQKLEVIPEEVGRYMEQSASMRGQPQGMLPQGGQQQMMPPGMMPPGMMPPGMMPPGGMMPGSNNPMDMLQMQQMQQMQQMFGNMQPPTEKKDK